jgi:hypothetical protein
MQVPMMATYETRLTLQDPERLELRNLPFRPGQRVKVIVLEDDDIEQRVRRWRELFQRTQALPQARTLTEEEIAAEIDAYREGR